MDCVVEADKSSIFHGQPLSRAPDGSCLLTCSNDNKMRLFNLPTELYSNTALQTPEFEPLKMVGWSALSTQIQAWLFMCWLHNYRLPP